MTRLLDTLRSQHESLAQLLGDITASLAASDEVATRTGYASFLALLQEHLALEDEAFYPELLSVAEKPGNATLAIVATSFASNMERISVNLRQSLLRHAGEDFSLPAFAADWPQLVDVLRGRISAEESSLYPMYARAIGQQFQRTLARTGTG